MTWAPDVNINDSGDFIMYYSALATSRPARHCIGVAIAFDVQGPYSPIGDTPFICPLSEGGAIDPSGFRDTDGTKWIVYKVDGNSLGNGGLCGNTVEPIVPTPIMLQRLAGDGITLIGDPIEIIDRGELDGPLVEAPALMKTRDGRYVLFFSSSCFDTEWYDISYAIASNVTGPYTKYGPFALTSTSGLFGPGGAHVSPADIEQPVQHMVFHAGQFGSRYLYTAEVALSEEDVETVV